ncbi:PBECR2 nuclease fold domain-containing protein [Porphyromonas sp. COT-290 OH860]|uniref:PBECR2 nuclease fold domain-containing protein n=1 Tax=Porphyromonas sp. COT-290 OH860 TaxID=1515615 RepID=UPI00052C9561|nr:PBECR2 nuclease fold domain-containing protein [Porphyromonas sp. COT-290 OH860]KGN81955.1 hypothetical protein HQ41_09200 [Porphyromonas sp. COT-290 OH860]
MEGDAVNIKHMQDRVHEYQTSSDWEAAKALGWGVNKAEIAEVFTANQQYIHKMPSKSSAKLLELGHNDYGLDSIQKEIAKEYRPKIPIFEGDKQVWYETHKILQDYKGRSLLLSEGVFTRHTSKKYEAERIPLLECIPEALSTPDEVWLNDYQGKITNYNYIKYYQGRCINVVCELKDGKVYQVTTWFEVGLQYKSNLPHKVVEKEGKKGSRARRDPRHLYRRGLLIKKG